MKPYTGSIESATLNNAFFRQVLFTGDHSQLVVMCIQPGEEIGEEVHDGTDQFFRIEEGAGTFVFGDEREQEAGPGDAVIVPAGTSHNVVNRSSILPLRLYTIYSPPNHPDGTVHMTRADAAAAEHAHDS